MNEEIFFRSIYEHMGVPIFVLQVDVDGDFVFGGLNPACEKATGLRNEDVAGKRPEEISGLPQENAAALRANCQRCLETNEAIQCEAPFVGRTQEAWWLTRLSAVRDEAGKIVQIIGSSVDITDLKRAEDALRESERKYRDLIDGMNETVWVIDFDTTILDVNNAAAKVLGYTREELLSAKISDIDDNLTPEQIQDLARSMPRDKIQVFKTWHETKDGRRLPVEVSSSLVSYGGRTVILSIARDMTERKRAEGELMDAHKQLERSLMFNEALLSAIPTPVFYKDKEGRYLGCNQAFSEFTGASADQIKGKTVMELWPSENAEIYHQRDLELMHNPELQTYEFIARDKNGIDRPVIFAKNVFRDESKHVAGIVGTFVDIAERKRAEQERLVHLGFLESMDRINRAIQGTSNPEQMMSDVLDVVLSIFECDRAFLMYPCDPGATAWRVPKERNKPEYPGVLALGLEMPMDPDVAETLRILLANDGPVQFGPGTRNALPAAVSERFGFKCFMSMAIYPRIGSPWQFGIHQCSYARIWTAEDERLFKEIGRRLADGLASLLTFRDLRCAKELWERTFDAVPELVAVIDDSFHIVQANKAMADRLNLPNQVCIGKTCYKVVHGTEKPPPSCPHLQLLADGLEHSVEMREERLGGDFLISTSPLFESDGRLIGCVHVARDITKRKRINSIMQARLCLLEFANSHSMDEFLTATLDEMEALTGSSIGFYHFLDADQKTLSLQSWSTNTLENMCTATGRGSHYDVAQAGVWVDCVHERRAVIHNDYASLPHRKGMPEGHAPVTREVVVPIFRGNLIKAIVGVGNKPTNYDEGDVDILSQLGDLSWDIVERMQTEEALKESEERYRLLFQRSPVGVFHYDMQLHITDCNDRFVAILQSSRDRLVGLDMKTLRDQSVLSALRQAAEGKEGSYEGFYRATTSSAEIWISMRTAPLVDLQGQVKGGIGIVEDITERRQAEDALRRSENEKAILNQIASIFLTIPDEAMYGEVLAVVLQVMKSNFGIFGYIGEDGDLVMPSLTREIWSECQVPSKSIVFPTDSWGTSLWGRAIREKKAFCSNGPFRTPEGHIHIDHFLTVPIVYGQETIGLISVANKEGGYAKEDKDFLERIVSRVSPILNARLQRDAQERRRRAAERNLRESEEKYRLLITNAGEAIFIIQDDAVKFPNPKALEMSGYSTEELAGIPFIDLVHPSDKEAVLEGYLKLLEGKQPEPFPFRIIDKKGKERWVQLTTAPIIWEKKPGILCFLRDVTDEKKLEAQLTQAQKTEALGRLAGGVAHDFNNMLTVIIGNAEMALMDVASSDPLYARLQKVDNAARRSADLTRQLLAFARKQTISPKVLNLNDTVSSMLEMLRRLIGEDIDLAWRPWAELWPVKIDPSQIDQVLANLCVNARDAIAGVGKVTVETGNIAFDEDYCATHPDSIPGEYVLLAVSDDGCGMDQETQAHLFEPFFTTKSVGKGTGLGLATVYGIVKQNDGFINVYSEPGQGTTFKIYFPRHKAEPAGPLVETAAETPHGGRETVLMVEDEEAIVDIGKSILEKLGYTVLMAKTPGEAIRLAEMDTGDIRLLITDVVMPEMNGHDLAERLASIKPGLKCLYMSGYTANVIAHRGILEAGVYFIQKPFSMMDLAAKVREVLDQKSADSNRERGNRHG
ncbi:MAG: PAS domain S-box protein [Deltaproteobacteria bacterium]|nr:PAS domain S-box protein [Deltaproteobacteria bacterium]